jgi:rRNA maturation protein Rpf1
MVLTTSANPFDRTERFVKHFMHAISASMLNPSSTD